MERQSFLKWADECLERVAAWLEEFDPDEVDFTLSDGVLKIVFPDATTFVLNRQTAADQMWFAAGVRAWHYDRAEGDGTWRADKDGHELLGKIREVVGAKLGRPVAPLA